MAHYNIVLLTYLLTYLTQRLAGRLSSGNIFEDRLKYDKVGSKMKVSRLKPKQRKRSEIPKKPLLLICCHKILIKALSSL